MSLQFVDLFLFCQILVIFTFVSYNSMIPIFLWKWTSCPNSLDILTILTEMKVFYWDVYLVLIHNWFSSIIFLFMFPVCLTILSDDEDPLGLRNMSDENFHSDTSSQMSSCDKEPVITNDMIIEMKQSISGKWNIDYLLQYDLWG